LIFGGDDGVMADNAAELKEKHPGFSDVILSYNTLTNTWVDAGSELKHKNKRMRLLILMKVCGRR
jgi:hypothetical protein